MEGDDGHEHFCVHFHFVIELIFVRSRRSRPDEQEDVAAHCQLDLDGGVVVEEQASVHEDGSSHDEHEIICSLHERLSLDGIVQEAPFLFEIRSVQPVHRDESNIQHREREKDTDQEADKHGVVVCNHVSEVALVVVELVIQVQIACD